MPAPPREYVMKLKQRLACSHQPQLGAQRPVIVAAQEPKWETSLPGSSPGVGEAMNAPDLGQYPSRGLYKN